MLTNYISVWNVCMRNIFAKDKHYHHNRHSNSLHCPLHWWSFRDQVNICWNHTKPNCNGRSRTNSINHTSNFYVDMFLKTVIGIKSFTAFIQCTGWKSFSNLVVLVKHCSPYQNTLSLKEDRHFLTRHLVLMIYQWCFSSIQFYS